MPGHAHRDVGAPRRCRTTCACCAPAASTSWSPRAGRLAGGDVGAGRLAEPETIVAAVDGLLAAEHEHDLTGLRVVVTAGGTREPIDPVRFIGNRSSGKQGHAVAEEAASRGRQGHPRHHHRRCRRPPAIDVVRVDTAAEMEQAVLSRADQADVVVMAAAVADFRPVDVGRPKIKKAGGVPEVVLEPTTDILAALGAQRRPGQTIVGLRGRDRRPPRQRRRQARPQGHRPHRGQRRVGARRGLRARHERGGDPRADGAAQEIPLTDKRAVARAILDAVSTTRSNP